MTRTRRANSLAGPLHLQDEGTFFVNGQTIRSDFPNLPAEGLDAPGEVTVNQMYVHYRIPENVAGRPIVLVHGANHTGVTYETTPDGREGWATYFARKGFPVYVVDQSGRGRSGFNAQAINQAKQQSKPEILPTIRMATQQRGWVNFRFGARHGEPFPDCRFPLECLEQYYAQLVPDTEVTLEGAGAQTVNGLVALLEEIGPALVFVHSQSGPYGLELVHRRPDLVAALVHLEAGWIPFTADEIARTFARVPMLAVWGDYSEGAVGANGDERRNGCRDLVAAITAAGGTARFLLLPDIGIRGNTHMFMMDSNNLQVADVILAWLDEVA